MVFYSGWRGRTGAVRGFFFFFTFRFPPTFALCHRPKSVWWESIKYPAPDCNGEHSTGAFCERVQHSHNTQQYNTYTTSMKSPRQVSNNKLLQWTYWIVICYYYRLSFCPIAFLRSVSSSLLWLLRILFFVRSSAAQPYTPSTTPKPTGTYTNIQY